MTTLKEQAMQLHDQFEKMHEHLKHFVVEGVSENHMVKILLGKNFIMKDIDIAPELFQIENQTLVEKCIVEAYNDAQKKLSKVLSDNPHLENFPFTLSS